MSGIVHKPEAAAVAVIKSNLTISIHSKNAASPVFLHGPPVNDTILAFTTNMYVMVTKLYKLNSYSIQIRHIEMTVHEQTGKHT